MRANYQTAIWRRSLKNYGNIPEPIGYRWLLEKVTSDSEDVQLEIDWMSGKPAPEAVLDLIACNCSKACYNESCTCFSNKLKCTNMCKINNCSNQEEIQENEDPELDLGFSDSDTDI